MTKVPSTVIFLEFYFKVALGDHAEESRKAPSFLVGCKVEEEEQRQAVSGDSSEENDKE